METNNVLISSDIHNCGIDSSEVELSENLQNVLINSVKLPSYCPLSSEPFPRPLCDCILSCRIYGRYHQCGVISNSTFVDWLNSNCIYSKSVNK